MGSRLTLATAGCLVLHAELRHLLAWMIHAENLPLHGEGVILGFGDWNDQMPVRGLNGGMVLDTFVAERLGALGAPGLGGRSLLPALARLASLGFQLALYDVRQEEVVDGEFGHDLLRVGVRRLRRGDGTCRTFHLSTLVGLFGRLGVDVQARLAERMEAGEMFGRGQLTVTDFTDHQFLPHFVVPAEGCGGARPGR